MIPAKLITLNQRRQSVAGFRDPPTGTEIKLEELPKTVQRRFEKAEISQEDFEKMVFFAKNAAWLSGHRKLKMNAEQLRGLVVSNTNSEVPATDSYGLRRGGLVSESIVKQSRAPLNVKGLNLNIKNKNRLPQNPSYTSFKNDFALK